MKKNAKLRLTLNRETLRNLDPAELEAAPGGVTSIMLITQSCYNCPTIACSKGCPTLVQNCTTSC